MRVWIFRFVTAIVLPAVVITATEGSLRLLSVGYPSELTVPCTVRDLDAFCDNDHFTWQFFPPGAFRLPPAFAIPAQKPPGSFRIFIVGESAAQGDPEPAYSFGRYLEVMLRERFPTIRFEVVNTGIAAVNSHVLLPAVRNLARRDGDLFVLYIGNNEVVGPYGAGTTLTRRGGSLGVIRAGIFLNSTRIGQLLRATVHYGEGSHTRAWRGMEMFLKHQVPADATELRLVYEHFRRNLLDIVSSASASGAHVLISTVGVNLADSAPFASLHRPDLKSEEKDSWEQQVRDGAKLEKIGRFSEALERYVSAAAIDDRHAELQYRIGRAYWELEQFAAADKRFRLARDLDALRFRADSPINEIIRSVGRSAGPGVELLDVEELFAEASIHGVPGRELFYEHVHLTGRGNYLLARALFARVVALLPERVRGYAKAGDPPSQEEAERLLALTAFDRRRVALTVMAWLTQPPFTARLNNEAEVVALSREAKISEYEADADATYRRAIASAPHDRWLQFNHGIFLETHDPAGAVAAFRRALELLPNNYSARQRLADALVAIGNYHEAIAQCRELLRRMPYHAPAYLTMAFAQAQLGSLDESIASYQRAVELHSTFGVDANINIGLIQIQQGRFDRALESFKKAVAADVANSRTAEIRRKLSYALQKLGRSAEAQQLLRGEVEPSDVLKSEPADKPIVIPDQKSRANRRNL